MRPLLRTVLSLLALPLLLGPAVGAAPVRVILDVDLCEDVDDAGALAVLHALADRGEAEILATLISARNEWVGPCLDAINTWYGRPDLPIGYQRGQEFGYRNAKDPQREATSLYAEAVAKRFPHDLKRSSDAPEAATLCREILESRELRKPAQGSSAFSGPTGDEGKLRYADEEGDDDDAKQPGPEQDDPTIKARDICVCWGLTKRVFC